MSDWSKVQLIERGVTIIPLRDKSQCDEWVLRSEAERLIDELTERVEELKITTGVSLIEYLQERVAELEGAQ